MAELGEANIGGRMVPAWLLNGNANGLDISESSEYPGCIYRKLSGGSVEWFNPPMLLGVEYRTMERYLGIPVYKKMDSDGVIWWSTDQSTWKREKASAYEHQPEIEITSDYFDVPIYVKKDDAGNVHINIWNALTLQTIPQYGWVTVGSIPTGYRPSHTILVTSNFFTSTTVYTSAIIMVDNGGNLQVSAGGDRGVAIPNNARVNFSGSWGT